MFSDTHCHLDFNKFDLDRPDVVQRAVEDGIHRILVPGITLDSSRKAIELAERFPQVYAAIGIHPNDALTWDNVTVTALGELAANLKVIAIGEIGLDYYWNSAPQEHQVRVLRSQLDLAAELGLPVVLHMREKSDADRGSCSSDLITILQDWVQGLRAKNNPLQDGPGVLHSFSGSLEIAEQAMELGFYIGVTGPVTFENALTRQSIVSKIPLERLLIETDAPFLTPHPHRGKRNEPMFVRLIADKISQLHSRNLEEVAEVTSSNAARLFSWGGSD